MADSELICTASDAIEGEHEWKVQDDSFDHEFGTEQIHYWLCIKCGMTKAVTYEDYQDDEY